MSSSNPIKNYLSDIETSKNTPLLIELSKKDLDVFSQSLGNKSSIQFPIIASKQLYDKKHEGSSYSDVITIDADKVILHNEFTLLEILLDQLRGELKSITNIAIFQEIAKSGLSMATGGLVDRFAGSYFDQGVELIFKEVSEHFQSSMVNNLQDKLNVSELLSSQIEGTIHDLTGESLGCVFGEHIKDKRLFLSTEAISELHNLFKSFSDTEQSSIFQLTFKLLLCIGLNSQKLLFINNPHKLDDNSLAVLSLFLSYAKYQKDHDMHVGLSIVYQYSDLAFQPYQLVEKKYEEKKQLLDDQRRFTQRYAMLERPTSSIPKVAIRSSLFIGRQEELNSLNTQFHSRPKNAMAVITGEPGIGKTALINKHLTQVQSTTQIISLSLINEIGNSSLNTGLSSIEQSIINEAPRLEYLSSWKDKGSSFVKRVASKENAAKAIKTIFSDAAKIVNVGMAVHERVIIDDRLDSIKCISLNDLNSDKDEHTEQQFNNLDRAIDKLIGINSKSIPIVLFIDDIQWIDERSCEYIYTRLLQREDVYIIASLRPSDAATRLKNLRNSAFDNYYTEQLFKTIGVTGSEVIESENALPHISAVTTQLQGFDKQALEILLSKVIKGEPKHINVLTSSIFSTLISGEEECVNTLFAIETINMLCDERLYDLNADDQLILNNPLRINTDIKNIETAINDTFMRLKNKHAASLSHYSESLDSQSFNLMAYAVMEERLHLIKLYFSEYGNAAVNTLLFSTLLGAPFSSNLVKRVFEELLTTDRRELQPLKDHFLQGKQQTSLREEHYEIIDEVYEILKRHSVSTDKYQYRHALLHIFLDKQLDFLLNYIFTEDTTLSANILFEVIISTIKSEYESQSHFRKELISLTADEVSDKLFYKKVLNNAVRKAYSYDPDVWAIVYLHTLIDLAQLNNDNYQADKAIYLAEQALVVCKNNARPDDKEWSQYYSNVLSFLSKSYKNNHQIEQAIYFAEKALVICDKWQHESNGDWGGTTANCLTILGETYSRTDDVEKAIQYLSQAVDLKEAHYQEKPESNTHSYCNTLNNLAITYLKNSQTSMAIAIQEKLLKIIKQKYEVEPEQWAAEYTASLSSLACSLIHDQQVGKAKELLEISLSITEVLYEKSPDLWAVIFNTILNNLATTFMEYNQTELAVEYIERSLIICEEQYDRMPYAWAEKYPLGLNNLAMAYKKCNRVQEAIELELKALFICESQYEESQQVWAAGYFLCLNNLAESYTEVNNFNQAFDIYNRCLNQIKQHFDKAPSVWAERYINTFISVSRLCQKNKKLDLAISTMEMAISLCKENYKSDSFTWCKVYVNTLRHMSLLSIDNDNAEMALNLAEDALVICTEQYHASPYNWTKVYIDCLNDLGLILFKIGDFDKSIELLQKAIPICKVQYDKEPSMWITYYISSLNNLGKVYDSTSQVDKMLDLSQLTLSLAKEQYQKSPNTFAEMYISTLYNLAATYTQLGQFDEAMGLFEKLVSVSGTVYEAEPTVWAEKYTDSLLKLGKLYYHNNKIQESIKLFNNAFEISDKQTSLGAERWLERSAEISIYLVNALYQLGENVEDISFLADESLELGEKWLACYSTNNKLIDHEWAINYFSYLQELVSFFRIANQLDGVLELLRSFLFFCDEHFKSEPKLWSPLYTSLLKYMADLYSSFNHIEMEIILKEQLVLVQEELHDCDSIVWDNQYVNELINLAELLYQHHEYNKAIILREKLLSIRLKQYEIDPSACEQPFVFNLNNLALLYNTTNQVDKAIPLLEQAFNICISNIKTNPLEWKEHFQVNLTDLVNSYTRTNQDEKLAKLKILLSTIYQS
ncbi:tetratricopeptide repeat protein [Vibrio coralliirubri]|uniref:tetratricopeptide repeat protein n=1 Tax=Vibrio coralliirubri TaxID=1516159 RepID=UPI0006398728|nr:tetratricopeptide repeat protein [Vibrio coralliirubri]CDU08802.1 conserved hypothetical protein [Vibrio coralliirubri]